MSIVYVASSKFLYFTGAIYFLKHRKSKQFPESQNPKIAWHIFFLVVLSMKLFCNVLCELRDNC